MLPNPFRRYSSSAFRLAVVLLFGTSLGCAERASLVIEIAAPEDVAEGLSSVTVTLTGQSGQPLIRRVDVSAGRTRLFDAVDLVEGQPYWIGVASSSLDPQPSGCTGGRAIGSSPLFVYGEDLTDLVVHVDCPDRAKAAGNMAVRRVVHTANFVPTALPYGEVVLIGGADTAFDIEQEVAVKLHDLIEIYDAGQGTFKRVDDVRLAPARALHQTLLLDAQRLIITGGYGVEKTGRDTQRLVPLSLVDQLDASGLTPARNLGAARAAHAAVALDSRRVAVAKGIAEDLKSTWSVEALDPDTTGTVAVVESPTKLIQIAPAAVKLPDGTGVLLIGGAHAANKSVPNELLCLEVGCGCEPPCLQSTPGFPEGQGRVYLSATLVTCTDDPLRGAIYIVGGSHSQGRLGETFFDDIYCIPTDAPQSRPKLVGHLHVGRAQHTTTLVRGPDRSRRLFVAGGTIDTGGASQIASNAELIPVNCRCEVGTQRSTVQLQQLHVLHTATLLPDGTVLLAGGPTRGAERFTPAF